MQAYRPISDHLGKHWLQRGIWCCTEKLVVFALFASRLLQLHVVCMDDTDISANSCYLLFKLGKVQQKPETEDICLQSESCAISALSTATNTHKKGVTFNLTANILHSQFSSHFHSFSFAV